MIFSELVEKQNAEDLEPMEIKLSHAWPHVEGPIRCEQ